MGIAQIMEWKFASMLAISSVLQQIPHTKRSIIQSKEIHRNPTSHPAPETPPEVKQLKTKQAVLMQTMPTLPSLLALIKQAILQVMNSQKYTWCLA